MYECLYEILFLGDVIVRVVKKYSIVYWINEMYGFVFSFRCKNYKMLMFKLEEDDFKFDFDFGDIRLGKVLYYLMYLIEVNCCIKVYFLVVVDWFRKINVDFGYFYFIISW